MTRLCILGAGGHGKVLLDVAQTMGVYTSYAFYDADPALHGTQVLGVTVAGDETALPPPDKNVHVIVAIGMNNALRVSLIGTFLGAGYVVPSLVHASAAVSLHAQVDEGAVVMAQAAVNPASHVGRGAIINTGAVVDHDGDIGRGAHLAPGSFLSGGVRIGAATLVGTGATVIQGLSIGAGCIIGAGASVVTDIPDHCVAVGVPAQVIRRNDAV